MRILLVEDHADLRRMTMQHLAERGFVVDDVGTMAEAEDALAAAEYDALILDLGLPDGDGTMLLSSQRRRGAPTLILTARDDVEARIGGLNAGADDYLIKPFDLGELEARLRAVLRRPRGRAPVAWTYGDLRFETAHFEAFCREKRLPIRRREALLLEALLQSGGRVVVRDNLEDRLYGFAEAVTPNALEASVSRLRKALVEAGSNVVVEAVRGVGYLLRITAPTPRRRPGKD